MKPVVSTAKMIYTCSPPPPPYHVAGEVSKIKTNPPAAINIDIYIVYIDCIKKT